MKKQLITIAVALLTAGALTTSCSSEDNTIETPQTQQPATNTITLTATLAPKGDDGGTTRAITPGTDDVTGKEILNVTWAADEEISIYYQTATGYAKTMATVQSVDATTGVATIIASLDANTTDGGTVKFVYPASLANVTGDDIEETKLLSQNGNLTGANGISTKFDAATGEGKIHLNGGTTMPTTATVTNTAGTGNVSLQNRICICKFRFDVVESYGASGPTRNFSTPVIINDGNGHTYTITSDRDDGTSGTRGFNSTDNIYVAMLPISDKIVTFSTTYSPNDYSYTAWHTTLLTGKFYRNLSINMVKGGYVYSDYNLTGSAASTVIVPDGETLTLNGATINVSSGPAIRCEGNATIVLTGTNSVTTSAEGQPAIFIPEGKTLTIQGTGSLTAESTNNGGAGIGGGYQGGISYAGINCGNIIIESGTVTATGRSTGIGGGAYGTCGTITINGGTVTATGGDNDAGIGSGYNGTCGNITISGGNVEATGGVKAAGIGSGYKGTCSTITINGGTVEATGGYNAAGIGTGTEASCGDITITSGVTSVTAKKGNSSPNSIGRGYNSTSCGTVTIGGNVGAITTSPYTYQP